MEYYPTDFRCFKHAWDNNRLARVKYYEVNGKVATSGERGGDDYKYSADIGCVVGQMRASYDQTKKDYWVYTWFMPFGSLASFKDKSAEVNAKTLITEPSKKSLGTSITISTPVRFIFTEALIPDPFNGIDYCKVYDNQSIEYSELQVKQKLVEDDITKLEKAKADLLASPERKDLEDLQRSIRFIYKTFKKGGTATDPVEQLMELGTVDKATDNGLLALLNSYAQADEPTLDKAYEKLQERLNKLKQVPRDIEGDLISLQNRWEQLKKDQFPGASAGNLIDHQTSEQIRQELSDLNLRVPVFTSELQILNHLISTLNGLEAQQGSVVGQLKASIREFKCDLSDLQAELDRLIKARLSSVVNKYDGRTRKAIPYVICAPKGRSHYLGR